VEACRGAPGEARGQVMLTSPPYAEASTTSTHAQALHAGSGAAEVCRGAWR
jgi:hypothetical protein